MTNKDQGWISLHRRIRNNEIWKIKPFSPGQAWIDMLLRANHKEGQVLHDMKWINVDRGQFVSSSRRLADDWGWSRTKIMQFLATLESDKTIIQMTDKKKTTVTICNYDSYQRDQTIEEKKPQKSHQSHHRKAGINDEETIIYKESQTTEKPPISPQKDINNNKELKNPTFLNLPNMKVVLNGKRPLADSTIVVNALIKIGLGGKRATEIYQQYGKEYLIRKIYLYEYTVIFGNGKIGKPLAWIQNAIKEDYEESDQYLEWLKDKKETTLNNPDSPYELKALAGLI